jgi:hydroxymethylpyrimidine/phosphomethylpyrimidine kinase
LVTAIHEVPPDVIRAQISAVLDDFDVRSIKIGMLATAEIIEVVARSISGFSGPVVVDPVMVAKSGDRLLREEAVDALKDLLVPMATVLTPNLPEAADILGTSDAGDLGEFRDQARQLSELGAKAVLMKGGHASADVCTDLLRHSNGEERVFTALRRNTRNTHGTGCTYSSAIASGLAKRLPVEDAVATAHAYLQAAISAADSLHVGLGHGPVHHFHSVWAP